MADEGWITECLGVPLDMSRMHLKLGNPSDQPVVADPIPRQEPDEEEDGTKDDDGDRDHSGYSE